MMFGTLSKHLNMLTYNFNNFYCEIQGPGDNMKR